MHILLQYLVGQKLRCYPKIKNTVHFLRKFAEIAFFVLFWIVFEGHGDLHIDTFVSN